jgi:hypothetical protein
MGHGRRARGASDAHGGLPRGEIDGLIGGLVREICMRNARLNDGSSISG